MKKIKAFSAKALSLVCALALVLTAVIIPSAVTASAEIGGGASSSGSDYFFVNYTDDDAYYPQAGTLYTDDDGDSFYSLCYFTNTGGTAVLNKVNGTLNGSSAQLLQIASQGADSTIGAGYWSFVPLDANGKPFMMEANSTYKIDIKFYKQYIESSTNIYLSEGTLISDIVSGGVFKDYCINGTINLTGTTYRRWFAAQKYNTSLSSGSAYYNADNAANTFTESNRTRITTTITTDATFASSNKVTTSGFTYKNYFQFQVNTTGKGENSGTRQGLAIESISIKKVVSTTLNAGTGTINGLSTYSATIACGDALPAAYKEGYAFKGWYFDSGLTQPVGEYASSAIAGRTLYAKYGSGYTFDFDNKEIKVESLQEFYDEDGIISDTPVSDSLRYRIYSWFPGSGKQTYTNSTNYAENQALEIGTSGSPNGGGIVINDGDFAIMLEQGKTYRLKYNVYFAPTGTHTSDLGIGPAYNPQWANITSNARIQKVTRFENTGITYIPNSEEFTYYYEGELKKGVSGNWYTCSDVFTVPAAPAATSTTPIPYALCFGGVFLKKYMYVDDIVLEQIVEVTLHNGANATNQEVTYNVGDALPATASCGSDNTATFQGWCKADGTLVSTVTSDMDGTTLYAKWNYTKLSMNLEFMDNVGIGKYYSADGSMLTTDSSDASRDAWSYFPNNQFQSVVGTDGNTTKAIMAYSGSQTSYDRGAFAVNDGFNTFKVQEGKSYQISYDVKISGDYPTNNTNIYPAVGPIRGARVNNAGLKFDDLATKFTSGTYTFTYFENCVQKTGGYVSNKSTAGGWYHVSNIITIDSLPTGTLADDVLVLVGSDCGGAYITYDNIVVEEVEIITFDARNGVKYKYAIEAGDTLTKPTPTKSNATFAGWYNDDNTPFTATTASASMYGKTVYAKWIYNGTYTIDFDGDEIFYTEPVRQYNWQPAQSDDQIGRKIWYNGTDYSITRYTNNWKSEFANQGTDSSYAIGALNNDANYAINGVYPLNDGYDFVTLDTDSIYKIELDVKANKLSSTLSDAPYVKLGYNGYYNSGNWGGETGLYTPFSNTENIVVYNNNSSFTSIDDFGTHTTANNSWVHLVYTVKTPSSFVSAANYPVPNVLCIRLMRSGNETNNDQSSVFVDNITLTKLSAEQLTNYEITPEVTTVGTAASTTLTAEQIAAADSVYSLSGKEVTDNYEFTVDTDGTETNTTVTVNQEAAASLVTKEKGIAFNTKAVDFVVNKDTLGYIEDSATADISFYAANTDELHSISNAHKAVNIRVNNGVQVNNFGGNVLRIDIPVTDNTFVVGKTYVVAEVDDSGTKYLGGECIQKNGNKYIKVNAKGLSDFVVTFDTIAVNGLQLTVGGDLTLSIFAQLPESIQGEDVQFYVVRGDTPLAVSGEAYTEGGAPANTFKFTYPGITPQHINTPLTLIVKKNNETIYTRTTSVREYCDDAYAKADTVYSANPTKAAAFKTWLADLLAYGAASQTYLSYNTSNLANTGFAGTQSTFTPLTSDVRGQDDAATDFGFTAANLRFDNAIEIKLVYTIPGELKSTTSLSFKKNGTNAAKTITSEGTTYTLYTNKISALGFDDVYTARLTNTNGEYYELRYSVAAYVYSKQDSADANLRNLVQRLYCYGLSSKAFVEA